MDKLSALNNYGYEVSYNDSSDSIAIVKPNQWNLIGIILLIISVMLIVMAFSYLTLSVTNFHPWLFRLGLSVGIILIPIGFGIRHKRNSSNIHINLKSRQLSLGESKSWGEGVKFKYAFDKISNPRFKEWKGYFIFLIEFEGQGVILFKLKKNKLDELKAEQLLIELRNTLV